MKRLFGILLAVVLALGIVTAGAQTSMTMGVDMDTIYVGETLTISYSITNMTSQNRVELMIFLAQNGGSSRKVHDEWYQASTLQLPYTLTDSAVDTIEIDFMLYNGEENVGTDSLYVTVLDGDPGQGINGTVTTPATAERGKAFQYQVTLDSAPMQPVTAKESMFIQTDATSTDTVPVYAGKELGNMETGKTYAFTATAPEEGASIIVQVTLAAGGWEKEIPSEAIALTDSGTTDPDVPDDDDGPATEKISNFVIRCYNLILGRDADPDGLQNWANQLAAGTASASEIITGFTHSQEFMNRNVSKEDTVEILYNTMLDRGSDPDGKANWVSYLEAGCSDASVINGFCGSQEFGNLCASYGITPGSTQAEERDRNKNVTAFVTRCYAQALNRGGDVSGLNHWCQQLMDRIQTPKQVASGFVFSPEMTNRNLSNGELVDMLYRLYLGREADPPGRENWVTLMENGMTLEQLNDGFADSMEFAGIVASYGLN